jgi:protein-S-isoprenylcysteine O-methyltransferase Ste14
VSRFNSHVTTVVAARYLLVGVVAPLIAIQLWIAASRAGLGSTLRDFRQIAVRALGPQSVFVYTSGLLFFAVAPYFLIFHTTQMERTWLEVLLLVARLSLSALLILFGWVTTIGTLSVLSQQQQQ